uniref:Uncharacterized protein n=1 Tax=Romanomermis culicivorax TaxID=13658 RepID=A0A915HZR3_ROMCU
MHKYIHDTTIGILVIADFGRFERLRSVRFEFDQPPRMIIFEKFVQRTPLNCRQFTGILFIVSQIHRSDDLRTHWIPKRYLTYIE